MEEKRQNRVRWNDIVKGDLDTSWMKSTYRWGIGPGEAAATPE